MLQPRSNKERPDNFVFIIGAMKCGTTSLFDILSQHPQICASKIKEPDFFTKDRDNDALDAYLDLWNWNKGSHSVAIESSVSYTKAPYITGVPERIHKSGLGQHKFIYMLRNPLSRIESQVRHGLFAGWGESLDHGTPDDALKYSSYVMQLEEFLRYFPKDKFLLITLEEFTTDPHEVLSNICRFLKIDSNFPFDNVTETRNSGNFFNVSPGLARLTQSSFGQFIAQKLLPVKIKNKIRNLISKSHKHNNKPSTLGRWRLTDKEKEVALKSLAQDLIKLEKEFGVNVQKYWQIQTEELMK